MAQRNTTRRRFLRRAGLGIAALAGGRLRAAPPGGRTGRRPNVLFIAVDDLRPQLKCYGVPFMVTPNLDRFAASGRLFLRQYVAMPTCGASRCALLTGQRPRSAARMNNAAFRTLSRTRTAEAQTMPELFRRGGYRTISIGKVSHQPDGHVFTYQGQGDGRVEVPFAWDEVTGPEGKWKTAWNAFFGYADGSSRTNNPKATATECADVDDEGYPDGLIAKAAVAKLRELRRGDRPFFLAVGFYKPHLPFVAPKRYWDLYDPRTIPMSPAPARPENINPGSWHRSGECFSRRYNLPSDKRSDPRTRRLLRHGYFAAVSYVDAQVGKVLDALGRSGMADRTIVVVWGDHGWHLGDLDIWGKHTNYEWALRSVLMVRTPGMPSPGKPTRALTEAIDLYPTLCELCGLKPPKGLDGRSLAGLLRDPDGQVKSRAFGYWRNGVTLRTDRYRITAYAKGRPVVELYDHRSDPHETTNVAARHPSVVDELLPLLRTHAATWPGIKIP